MQSLLIQTSTDPACCCLVVCSSYPFSGLRENLAASISSPSLLDGSYPPDRRKHWFSFDTQLSLMSPRPILSHILVTASGNPCVMEWCLSVALRQMRNHSRQRTAATRFCFCRPNQHKSSTNTTDIHSQTYTVSTIRKESKHTVQSSISSKQPNQQNLCFLGPLQLQISPQ